jgi:hypothetical protein
LLSTFFYLQDLSVLLKGIVSRDFVVCFLVSFDRSDIYTHQERVLLLLKVRFRIEFFDFCVWPWWAPEGKWCINLSKYRAHTQDILLLFMLIITDDPVKKNGANYEHVKRAADSSKEPWTGSVTSFNVILPIQHLHGRCLGLPGLWQ